MVKNKIIVEKFIKPDEQIEICPNCLQAKNENDAFCNNCGFKFKNEEPSPFEDSGQKQKTRTFDPGLNIQNCSFIYAILSLFHLAIAFTFVLS